MRWTTGLLRDFNTIKNKLFVARKIHFLLGIFIVNMPIVAQILGLIPTVLDDGLQSVFNKKNMAQ